LQKRQNHQRYRYPNDFKLKKIYNSLGYLKAIQNPEGGNLALEQVAYFAAIKTAALAQAEAILADAQYYLNRVTELQTQASNTAAGFDSSAVNDQVNNSALQIIKAVNRLLDLAELYTEWGNNPQTAHQNLKDNAQLYLASQQDASQAITYWRAKAQDAAGRITEFMQGNGLITRNSYHAGGQLQGIETGLQYQPLMRELGYEYNKNNSIRRRVDGVHGIHEDFEYDHLNRVTRANLDLTAIAGLSEQSLTTDSWQYANNGNITYASKLGYYSYDNQRPYAVTQAGNRGYSYNAAGEATHITRAGESSIDITWSSYGKPVRLQGGQQDINFKYGPDRSRYLRSTSTETNIYVGKAYEKITRGTAVTHKYFIYQDGKLVATHIKTDADNSQRVEYMHYDNLGSIDTITDHHAQVVSRISFSVFGERRGENWYQTAQLDINAISYTKRGYTGHEQIDELGLIHMNGRIYDPIVGRFLSADPQLQDPNYSQNFNRYSYVWNNPCMYTDPSGEFICGGICIGIAIGVGIGAAGGAYIGGVATNDGNFNPTEWDYNSSDTWLGMAGGAVLGGVSGGLAGYAIGAAAVASGASAALGTAGTIGFSTLSSSYSAGKIANGGESDPRKWKLDGKTVAHMGIGGAFGMIISSLPGLPIVKKGAEYLNVSEKVFMNGVQTTINFSKDTAFNMLNDQDAYTAARESFNVNIGDTLKDEITDYAKGKVSGYIANNKHKLFALSG